MPLGSSWDARPQEDRGKYTSREEVEQNPAHRRDHESSGGPRARARRPSARGRRSHGRRKAARGALEDLAEAAEALPRSRGRAMARADRQVATGAEETRRESRDEEARGRRGDPRPLSADSSPCGRVLGGRRIFAAFALYLISPPNGVYAVQVTNSYGCTVTSDMITVNVGVEEISMEEQLNIYPNPVADVLNVQWNNVTESANLSIRDLSGRLVFAERVANGNAVLDLSNLSSGNYILELQMEEGSLRKQVVKL